MRKRLHLPMVVLAAAVFGAGCPWSKFDDLEDRTPVHAMEKPSDFDVSEFGKIIVPLRAAPVLDKTIVIAGRDVTPFAVLRFGADGRDIGMSYPPSIPGTDARDLRVVHALIELPVATHPSSGNPTHRILYGVPRVGYVFSAWIHDDGTPEVGPPFDPGDAGFGGALAAGQFHDASGMESWAIATDSGVQLWQSSQRQQTCNVSNGLNAETRTLQAGRFYAEDNGRDAFVYGLPGNNVPGRVVLIRGQQTGGATGMFSVECEAASIAPPGVSRAFGQVLASADFDRDGLDDLVIADPLDNKVYAVINGEGSDPLFWTQAATALTPIPFADEGRSEPGFGSALAVADLDGDGTPELIVGDPAGHFPPDDSAAAAGGRVYIYRYLVTQNSFELAAAALGDTEPESDAFVGLGVAGMIFDSSLAPTRHELVVGAADELFVFYLTGISGDRDPTTDDPRQR